jgi:hypothetical protein
MTTIEHTPETVQLDTERQVFLAENGRRARILGIAARIAVGVTVLWLAALAAGMLGFGHLPGTSIEAPFNRLISGGGNPPKDQAPSTDSSGSGSVTPSARERAARAQAIAATAAKRSTSARTSASRPRPARRAASTQPVQPPPGGQSVIAQQPRQQGWIRQGYVAPPGRVRQVEPPVPNPGNAYGRVKKTTLITPPPPPPPPPGNGNGNGGTKLK